MFRMGNTSPFRFDGASHMQGGGRFNFCNSIGGIVKKNLFTTRTGGHSQGTGMAGY